MAACDQIKVSTFYFQRLTSAKKKEKQKMPVSKNLFRTLRKRRVHK